MTGFWLGLAMIPIGIVISFFIVKVKINKDEGDE